MHESHAIVSLADEAGAGRVMIRGSLRQCRQAMFDGALMFVEKGYRVERTRNSMRLRVFDKQSSELEVERHVIALDI